MYYAIVYFELGGCPGYLARLSNDLYNPFNNHKLIIRVRWAAAARAVDFVLVRQSGVAPSPLYTEHKYRVVRSRSVIQK